MRRPGGVGARPPLLDLLALSDDDRSAAAAALDGVAAGTGVEPSRLAAAFEAALADA